MAHHGQQPMAGVHAQNILQMDGQNYDLNDPQALRGLLSGLGQTIATQQQTIANLQANPGGLTAQQFQALVTAVTPQPPAPPQAVRTMNPVLSTANNQVPYEEHQVPVGFKDVKGFPDPEPFTGAKTDAEPFMERLKAYFAAKPEAMKFTKNRILYATTLMKASKTFAWAQLVRKAIALENNNDYYHDNWNNFQQDFITRFGLTNAPQHYFRELTNKRQPNGQNCKTYIDQFETLRIKANLPKDQAFHYLKQGTYAPYRTRLGFRENPITTYDDWCTALSKLQGQIDAEMEYRVGTMGSFNKLSKNGYHQRHGNRPPADDPMDVDAMSHKKKKTPPSKKPSVTGPRKPSNPSSSKKPSSQPPSYSSATKSSSKTSSSSQKSRKPFYCFICEGEGHYARDCKAQLNQIDLNHIRQIGMALHDHMEYSSKEEDVIEAEDQDIFQPLNEDSDEEEHPPPEPSDREEESDDEDKNEQDF